MPHRSPARSGLVSRSSALGRRGLIALAVAAWPAQADTAAQCCALARTAVAQSPLPDARRAERATREARAEVDGRLAAPELRLEVWDFPLGDPSRADRDGMYMIGLAQRLGVPGARGARARAAQAEARAAADDARDALRMDALDLAATCVEHAASVARRAQLDVLLGLARDVEAELTRGTVTAGLGAATRAAAERARLERLAATADGERAALRARLDAWAPSLAWPEALEVATTSTAQAATDDVDTDSRVASSRARVEAAAARAEAADAAAAWPAFEVALTAMQMPGARFGAGVMVGLELPWLWGPEAAMRDEARAMERAADADARAARWRVAIERRALRATLAARARARAALERAELPALRDAIRVTRAELGGARFELTAWLELERRLVEAELERVDHAAALALAEVALALRAPEALGGDR